MICFPQENWISADPSSSIYLIWEEPTLLTKTIITNKKYSFAITSHLLAIDLSVEVGKYGRIVLPKRLREKYDVQEESRLIITESMGRICLVPVKTYEKPTDALYGSLKAEKTIEEPKSHARETIRKKLLEEMK